MKQSIKTLAASGSTMVGMLIAGASVALAQIDVGTFEAPKGLASSFGGFLSSLLTIVMLIAALAVFLYLIWGAIS